MYVRFLYLGLTWDSISSCVRWMAPFVRTVNEHGQPKLKDFKKIVAEDRHNIQTHVDYLSMLVSNVLSTPYLWLRRKTEGVNMDALCVLE